MLQLSQNMSFLSVLSEFTERTSSYDSVFHHYLFRDDSLRGHVFFHSYTHSYLKAAEHSHSLTCSQ